MQTELTRPAAAASVTTPATIDLRPKRRWGERLIEFSMWLSGLVSILITAGIVVVLLFDALAFFRRPEVKLVEFLTGTVWQPQILKFGIFPLFNATMLTSAIGLLVAVPLGLMIAIYLSEYASPRARGILKPVLEILAGVPTVVFGYFALNFMTPILQNIFGKDVVEVFNVASAGIVIGILIIPLVSSMSEDALSAVPRALREGAYALGATRLETALRVVVPAAISGIAAAIIVGMSRAVGETMVVAIAAGAGPRNFASWSEALGGLNFLNPFKAAETMTGHMVRISGGDLAYDSIDYDSIFSIGLMLFIITFVLNLISRWIVRRFREEY
ncbi:MAG: phosphate ABC transporter permease subunit PstC [Caldilineales bacterium]|nr:phosphate ABC transporter permease subunit PstC [Caldilineales bacterium]MDW8319597.1 phosphate ABC transporter permease subunit PstC [Anaerolineae bacterium]